MHKKNLERLSIVQVKEEKKPSGNVYHWRRLNPYNPLTYITLALFCIIGVVLYGIVGVFKEIDFNKPFKYQ